MKSPSLELQDDFEEHVKEGLRGKLKTGDKEVIDSFKKALDTTTPETPGDPRDYKDKGPKKDKLEWW